LGVLVYVDGVACMVLMHVCPRVHTNTAQPRSTRVADGEYHS